MLGLNGVYLKEKERSLESRGIVDDRQEPNYTLSWAKDY